MNSENKSLGYPEIMAKLNEIGRPDFNTASAVVEHDYFRKFCKRLNPPIIDSMEIGTFNGLGTITLASIGRFVYTFDVAYRNQEYIWSLFPNIRNKISTYCGPQEFLSYTISEIKFYLSKFLNFNFAFIDGDHTIDAVRRDFEMVKFCGRVLFHDCWTRNMPIRNFVTKEIGGTIPNPEVEDGMYGYWEDSSGR